MIMVILLYLENLIAYFWFFSLLEMTGDFLSSFEFEDGNRMMKVDTYQNEDDWKNEEF